MKFTNDWFSHNIPNFQKVKELCAPLHVLEVGVHEGMASCWMLQNLFPDSPSCTLYGVDNFSQDARRIWLDNVHEVKRPNVYTSLYHNDSHSTLAALMGDVFDFIYLDGSHDSADVLLDICLCWKLLRKDGIVLCDDYQGGAGVKPALDAFLQCYAGKYEIVINNYQLGLRKKV